MTAAEPTISRSGVASLAEGLRAATPALLFGLRLWASVCLALYVAFALELPDPSWAATTAALICQPVLGASLRKSAFRMVGTVVGAIGIVILAALFRQDRLSFLVGLALWCAVSAFVATLLRNFAAYAAALAGYTAAILASDVLGPVGTGNGDVVILAIDRALEICIGILCAGVVLALTDLGHSPRKLAEELASLSTAITDGFADCFLIASSNLDEFRALRRDLLRRVIALDPMIDAAIGEASDLRYRSPVLQRAVSGLMETIVAWRWAAFEIARNRDAAARGEAHAIHDEMPRDRLSPDASRSSKKPAELREACCRAARSLTRCSAETPSQRLLADSAAAGMLGMARALNGLTGVVDPSDMIPVRGTARLHVPDWLPPSINALRVFLSVGAISLFWIASAWPSGALAITFCAVIVVLLPLQGDLAYSASMTFLKGCVLGAAVAAVLVFGILPRATSFPSLCLALGLALVPFGFLLARARNPLFFFAASVNFLPMLSITNGMTYDASQFWNSTSAILAGIAVGALAMLIVPPLSPAIRTQRLLALTLADLRRLAKRASPGRQDDWQSRGVARLLAMPEQAEPVERAALVAAVAVGKYVVRLRRVAPRFVPGAAVDAALQALAEGRSGEAIERLKDIDRLLAALPRAGPASRILLRLRAGVLAISGQLGEYAPYFDDRPIR
ncbi:MAG TPA: FUSC family protein [Roseiarcus sp.]|nr:FUSC family protein [Roseiarcus sp.]